METFFWIELISVICSIVFLLLFMRQNIWCWPFGILGSALGVVLFVSPEAGVNLYSEAILYSYYVWIGIYGWVRWNRLSETESNIEYWNFKQHTYAITLGVIIAPMLGLFMDEYLESNNPYLDAFTTTFSFIASYMQARRIMSSWHFWIAINAVTIVLYYTRGLQFYTGLVTVYFALSILGLIQWRKQEKSSAKSQ